MNLAFSLALHSEHAPRQRPRVGVLDLDIFGPSIPKLMALENADEPELTDGKCTSRHAAPSAPLTTWASFQRGRFAPS